MCEINPDCQCHLFNEQTRRAATMRKKITEGMEVQVRDDGHWLFFETGGHYAAVCVEEKFSGTEIVKSAIIDWVDKQFTA